MAAEPVSSDAPPAVTWVKIRDVAWQLLTGAVGSIFRYRVTGLAAEAAFFAILSLPPLIFGLAGTIGYFADRYDVAEVANLKSEVLDLASRALTDQTVSDVIEPTLDDVLNGGRFDVVSIGFVLALWSGSRALNVFIDTITIMYGLGGRRGIVKTRALSFSLYVIGLLLGIIVIPLLLAGPELVDRAVPQRLDVVMTLYWPTVLLLSIGFITTLYHLSVPVRTSWRYDIPGAVFTLGAWIGGSWVLRWVLVHSVGSSSIYGPLAAPIAVLIWLYLLSIVVLIGAAINASFDRVFPSNSTARARLEVVRRLRERATQMRLRDAGLVPEPEPDDRELVEDQLEEHTQRVIEDAHHRPVTGKSGAAGR
ncbi:MAG: YihY/virulence factor BrkB family protein [Nocardioidaceae bacterium]|nr:YihY/virulence factor BrkB family protein [Nocardioidaceae bacterium]